jgi:hypothetical protein
MTTRSLQRLTILAALVLFALPSGARAGDAPILVVGDWGIGQIDNKIMLYLGKGHYLETPIPAPPEGPRWDIVYRTAPWLAVGACALGASRLYRRRRIPQLRRP